MFNLGFSEMIVLAAIALIFIGPKQLPEIARIIGRLINEFKRATGDIVGGISKPQQELEDLTNDIRDAAKFDWDREGKNDSSVSDESQIDKEEKSKEKKPKGENYE